MKRKSPIPLEKVTTNLYAGEFHRLAELHPDISPSVALREILHAHITAIDEAVARAAGPAPTLSPEQLRLFDE